MATMSDAAPMPHLTCWEIVIAGVSGLILIAFAVAVIALICYIPVAEKRKKYDSRFDAEKPREEGP